MTGHEEIFLSLRLIGLSGEPTPLSPPNAKPLQNSRALENMTTSSQKVSREELIPASERLVRNLSIWVLFPAPSMPEKLTTTACLRSVIIGCSGDDWGLRWKAPLQFRSPRPRPKLLLP